MTELSADPSPATPRSGALRVFAGAASVALALGLAACATGSTPKLASPSSAATTTDAALQPEAATGLAAKTVARYATEAVVAAHPLAAQVGAQMLREGGSAVDAAIAAQLVLSLVEPQSSGLGGGAFLLHWDGRRTQAYDGRETAPAAVDESLFLDARGAPQAFEAAAVGGRSVGVPGLLRMLELAHRAHGRLPWSRLFDPAIDLAERGFPVGQRLHTLLQGDAALRRDPLARDLYYGPHGQALAVGSRLRNPEVADVLRRLALEGADALHVGDALPRAMVGAVVGHPGNPGSLTLGDLAAYRAIEREAVCLDVLRWRVCGMPPPSSGGLAVGQLLGLLERLPGTASGGPADFIHRYTEAARLAYADREHHVADPAFAAAPGGRWESLLAADYLDLRAAQVGARSMNQAPPGTVKGDGPRPAHAAPPVEQAATTHLSVVDAEGRAVALTSSIEAQFGSRVMVNRGLGLAGGFLLNNQLTDFSFAPRHGAGLLHINRVQPGKRPRSSMAPTLVFERGSDGRLTLVMVAGSPGGVPIPLYVARTVWAVVVEGLDAQAATALAHVGSLNGPTLIETGRIDAATQSELRARGHGLREVALTSGSHVLVRRSGFWEAGADPRREGASAGR